MNQKEIVNPEIEYFIVSLKHSDRKDKYMTLWRPDNKGYCWPLELSGRYKGYQRGYHNDGVNIPVPCTDIPQKLIVKDDLGRDCIKYCKASIEFIKLYTV
jgi:hypothetical protein